MALKACRGAGANDASALVDATLSAASFGPATLGFPHMVDYLNSFREGRLSGFVSKDLANATNAQRGIGLFSSQAGQR